MAYFTFISLAVFCAIAVAVCGANPQPGIMVDGPSTNINPEDNTVRSTLWLRSAISSLKLLILEDTTPKNTDKGLHSNIKQEQDKTLQVNEEDSALPVLIHKEYESSGIKVSPSPVSGIDRVNPFLRTKRSTCQIPANLPQMVRDLNSRLNASQIVSLNPQEQTSNLIPAGQPNTCNPENWGPRQEINLRSTCPWNIIERDLGENAFPRIGTFRTMAYFTFISLAVFCAVAVCGDNPQPGIIADGSSTNINPENNSVRSILWLRSAISSLKLLILEDNTPENTDKGLHSNIKQEQDKTLQVKEEDSALPVLIHKEHESSGIKTSPSPISGIEYVNPFIRTKRSTCQIPANLPQIVRDLNLRLNTSQILRLNLQEPTRNTIPASQPVTSNTNKWWPGQDDNLRSNCPWNITERDLGENAFPRYINHANCLCRSCIGSPSQRCSEIKEDVYYLYRQGCEDGLAIINTRNVTITVGCCCVSPPQNSPIPTAKVTE